MFYLIKMKEMLYSSLVVSPDHCIYKRMLPFAFTPSPPAKFKHLALTGYSARLHRPSLSRGGEHNPVATENAVALAARVGLNCFCLGAVTAPG